MKLRFKTKQTAQECNVYRCKKTPNGQYLALGYLCGEHAAKATPARDAGVLEIQGTPQFGNVGVAMDPVALVPMEPEEPPVEAQLKTQAEELLEVLEMLKDFEVETDEDIAFAKQERDAAKEQWEAWEAKRTAITKPMNKALRETNALFKPVQNALKGIQQVWSDKLTRIVLKRQEEQKKLLSTAAKNPEVSQEAMIAAAESVAQIPGATVIDNWKFDVIDESLLPREYLCPDVKKIGAVVKAMGEAADIPGIRVFNAAYLRGTKRS